MTGYAKVFLTFLSLLLLSAPAVRAQGHLALTSTAQVEQEQFNEEGRKVVKRVPAEKVSPGTEVILTTSYANTGNEAVENAAITNPISEHMVYLPGSARGAATRIVFSVDGGKSYDLPARLFVTDSTGRKRPAGPEDYTHVRWMFEGPLPPGAAGTVSFRAVLH